MKPRLTKPQLDLLYEFSSYRISCVPYYKPLNKLVNEGLVISPPIRPGQYIITKEGKQFLDENAKGKKS